MLKKIIFLLIVAFLLQINWSLAKAYCMHETGGAAQHIGHHQHQHSSPVADEDLSKPQKTADFHVDCASCLSVLTLATMLESKMAPTASVTHEKIALQFFRPTLYSDVPERPQWFIVA